jgi:SAM-dependent methyltransferase
METSEYDSEIELVESAVETIQDLFTHRETVDALLHERIVNWCAPIIDAYPDASWLTVGDNGADAWMLRQYGAKTVTASSLSDVLLRKAAEMGHLNGIEVRALNAEHFELPEDSFDLVLCCQAYHHVRRAPLAFYELMRVARIGFILIEPMECSVPRPLDIVRTFAKMILRRRSPEYDLFEPAGNFIYRISERDVYRMLTAVQLSWFAIKTFNSFYLPWLAGQNRNSLLARTIFKLGIGTQDVLSWCRLMSPGLATVFVGTGGDLVPAQRALHSAGFRIVRIPNNPYSSAS